MKNCASCSKAQAIGDFIKCGYKPPQGFFNSVPYYPMCVVNVRLKAIRSDKIPKSNCPVWSEIKTGTIGPGQEFETAADAIAQGVTSIKMPGKPKAISINPKDFSKSKSKKKAKK